MRKEAFSPSLIVSFSGNPDPNLSSGFNFQPPLLALAQGRRQLATSSFFQSPPSLLIPSFSHSLILSFSPSFLCLFLLFLPYHFLCFIPSLHLSFPPLLFPVSFFCFTPILSEFISVFLNLSLNYPLSLSQI